MLVLALGCIQQTPPKACTEEAKLCPDGSAVGRTGPNCEFAQCPQLVGNDSDAHGCKASAGYTWCESSQKCVRAWETPCQLTASEALGVARASACTEAGNISDANPMYNNNSRTWWFDILIKPTGCSPACVVFENRSAEINWRCTGAILYTVKTANSSLGEILIDGSGFTLYTFSPDTPGHSTCYGTCADTWPALTIFDTISIPKGMPGKMGAFMRTDNKTQVTYNGKPLYTYAGDSAPGYTNGQGVSGKWYVVNPTD